MAALTGLDKLAALTGTSKQELQKIAEEVQANHRKLNACQYHNFELLPEGQHNLSSRHKYRCVNCGGVIDGVAYGWHEIGRKPKP